MKIYYNGKIITLNDQREVVEGMVIHQDKVMKMGSSEEVLRYAGTYGEKIDLQGRTVIPGIVDSHNHIIEAGITMDGVLLFDCTCIDDVLELIAEKAKTLPEGVWIEGAGWIESQFKEYRPPTRWELDKAAPKNPVYLGRLFAGAVVNSLALEAAGIVKGGPQPETGTICLREDGEPNGYLINNAQRLVRAVVPRNIGKSDKQAELMAAI
jgi:predicted amidohydrolase YtcJ